MTADPLVGTWRLISWENKTADGRISYPVGTDALGYIITYSEDGYMFVAIMRPNRTKFSAGDLLGGTPEEKAHAAETYVSYCGTYDFRGETVIHHVELSLFPNWVGVDQERLVEVRANRLTLSTRPTVCLPGSSKPCVSSGSVSEHCCPPGAGQPRVSLRLSHAGSVQSA
jgi:Lipocalin-like domain